MKKIKEKGRGFLGEFKEFAIRGSVIDLAVAVIIGAALQGIIRSFLNDIFMPLLGLVFGNFDFKGHKIVLSSLDGTITNAIEYGAFITEIINFVLMAFAIFLLVKMINKLKIVPPKVEKPKPVKKCRFCMMEIDKKASRCPYCTSEL